MLIRICCILAFAYCSAATAGSENRVVYYFGGGESGSSDNSFTWGAEQVLGLQDHGWQVHALFGDVSNVNARKTLQLDAKRTISPFTTDNFLHSLDALATDITRGKYKPGDQLLIVMDTHGSPPNPNFHDTHYADGTWGTADGLVPREELRRVIVQAERKGLKIGIIDTSCWGGESLAFASAETCVISSTAWDREGRTDMGYKFGMVLKPELFRFNANLEGAFLEARKNNTSTSQSRYIDVLQMQISTDAGRTAQSALSSFERVADNMEGRTCTLLSLNQQDLRQLTMVIGSLALEHKLPFGLTKSDVINKVRIYNQLRAELPELNNDQICADTCFETWKIAKCAADTTCSFPSNVSGKLRPLLMPIWHQRDKLKQLNDVATELAKIEESLYSQMYAEQEKASPRRQNPCRDFKL